MPIPVGRLTGDDARQDESLDRASDHVRPNRDTAFGWALLDLAAEYTSDAEADKKDVGPTHRAVADAWPLFESGQDARAPGPAAYLPPGGGGGSLPASACRTHQSAAACRCFGSPAGS